MPRFDGMKTVLSFSGGKDSVLALHRLAAEGNTPSELLVMYNRDAGRSWFHGIEEPLLREIAASLGIPLRVCPCGGEEYHLAMRGELERARAEGADSAAFGDIDVSENRAWCEEQCAAAGLRAIFPLWGEARVSLAREVVSIGYECVIKCVRNADLPPHFLGRAMSEDVIAEMQALGVDPSGEGGEFLTAVLNGPLFARPVAYENRGVLDLGPISVADIVAKKIDR